jgi:tetratricopeptide (TPR) repeat protein
MPDSDRPTGDPSAPAPTRTGPHATDPLGTVTLPHIPVPFTDLIPHARGGLGEVFRGTDPDLHRSVAVKCLQDRHADNPDSRRRFLLEAEITARLEHPGVVPVYGLFPGGRPAYAMRFVEGQTLAEAITAYHKGPPDPVAFRRLLQSFLQVCQTVAYAHSRGVIHRDLKPANVMLGQFGETLVVDWGLAKVVGRPEEVRAAGHGETLVPSAESGASETAMGSAIGTPAYMSPEQAAGRWDVVAQPADVYSLGAVLYTVLTGKPPLEKGNWPEMQQRIQRGDFPRPREVKPDVPRALESVCLKAMALDVPARYPSAEALAADVEHWMAGEPVVAYREPLAARARRWMRNHRTLVSGAVVFLLVTVVGLSVSAVLLQRARVETDKQRASAVAAQKKAEAINRFLIDDLLKQADPENNPVGDKITVRQLLDKAAARLDAGAGPGDQPEVEAELRTVLARAYQHLGVFDQAERHYRRAWELLTTILGPDHVDTLTARNDYVYVMTDQGRPDCESLTREALDACTRALGEEHPETGRAFQNVGGAFLQQGKPTEAEPFFRRASRILHVTLGPNHPDTLDADNSLAVAMGISGRAAEAEPILRSVADRRRLRPHDPELTLAIANWGYAHLVMGNFADAERAAREAVAVGARTIGPAAKGSLMARNLLGYAVEGQGRWDEAESEYLAVLADRRRLLPPGSFDIQRSLGFLARLYAKQNRWADASRYLAELILAQKPDPNRKLEALAAALAEALGGTADPATAEPLLRESSEAVKAALWLGDWLRPEVASRYGDCLRRQGKFAEAEPILVAAANDVSKAVGVPVWGVATARKRVADLYEAWNKPAEAAKWK